jgi:hypothetical protein
VNTLVGDWALASVYVRQSGAVLGWSEVIYYGGDLQWNPRNISRVFDTTRFNTNSSQQLASALPHLPLPVQQPALGPDQQREHHRDEGLSLLREGQGPRPPQQGARLFLRFDAQ